MQEMKKNEAKDTNQQKKNKLVGRKVIVAYKINNFCVTFHQHGCLLYRLIRFCNFSCALQQQQQQCGSFYQRRC